MVHKDPAQIYNHVREECLDLFFWPHRPELLVKASLIFLLGHLSPFHFKIIELLNSPGWKGPRKIIWSKLSWGRDPS